LFFAARSYPTSAARRRFFVFDLLFNVPGDGGPPLLRHGKLIYTA
jgi:hypothetical protein